MTGFICDVTALADSFWSLEGVDASMRMEVITRTERRRLYSDAEKARLLAECDAPRASVKKVAERNDMAASVLHRWRLQRKQARAGASVPMQFVSFGEIVALEAEVQKRAERGAPRLKRDYSKSVSVVRSPESSIAAPTDPEPPLLPHPCGAPGTIAIVLTSGVRVSVDSYVNEKALARVLRTLKIIA